MAPFFVTASLLQDGFDMHITVDRPLQPHIQYFCRGLSFIIPARFISDHKEDRNQLICRMQVANPAPGDSYTFELVFQDLDGATYHTITSTPGEFHVSELSIIFTIPSIIPITAQIQTAYDLHDEPPGADAYDYNFTLRIGSIQEIHEDSLDTQFPCYLEHTSSTNPQIQCNSTILSDALDINMFEKQTAQTFHVDLLVNQQLAVRHTSVMVYQVPSVVHCTLSTSSNLISLEQMTEGVTFMKLQGGHICDTIHPVVAQFTLNGTGDFETTCAADSSGYKNGQCTHIVCPLPKVSMNVLESSTSSIAALQLSALLLTNYRYHHPITHPGASLTLYQASSARILRIAYAKIDCNFPSKAEIELELENLRDTGSIEVHVTAGTSNGPSVKFSAEIKSPRTIYASGTLVFPASLSRPFDLLLQVSLDGGLTIVTAPDDIKFRCNTSSNISVNPPVLDSSAQSLSGIAITMTPAPVLTYQDRIHFDFTLPDRTHVATTTNSSHSSGDSYQYSVNTASPLKNSIGPLSLRTLFTTNVTSAFQEPHGLVHNLEFHHSLTHPLTMYIAKNVQLFDFSPHIITSNVTERVTILGRGFPTHLNSIYTCVRIGSQLTLNAHVVNETLAVVHSIQTLNLRPGLDLPISLSFDRCNTFHTVSTRRTTVIPPLHVEIPSKTLYSFRGRPLSDIAIGGLSNSLMPKASIWYKAGLDIYISISIHRR